jgi:hypothetical protein
MQSSFVPIDATIETIGQEPSKKDDLERFGGWPFWHALGQPIVNDNANPQGDTDHRGEGNPIQNKGSHTLTMPLMGRSINNQAQ